MTVFGLEDAPAKPQSSWSTISSIVNTMMGKNNRVASLPTVVAMHAGMLTDLRARVATTAGDVVAGSTIVALPYAFSQTGEFLGPPPCFVLFSSLTYYLPCVIHTALHSPFLYSWLRSDSRRLYSCAHWRLFMLHLCPHHSPWPSMRVEQPLTHSLFARRTHTDVTPCLLSCSALTHSLSLCPTTKAA